MQPFSLAYVVHQLRRKA